MKPEKDNTKKKEEEDYKPISLMNMDKKFLPVVLTNKS